MLFHISPSVIEKIKAFRNDDKMISSFENLIQSARLGKHAVLLPDSARELLLEENLSKPAKGTIRHLLGKSAEILGLKKALNYYCEILPNQSTVPQDPRLCQKDGASVWSLDILWFEDPIRIQETVLLCENISDCEVLFRLAEGYKSSKGWRISLASDRSGGGGSNIKAEFERVIQARKPALCIVDSDKKHPNCALGSTARFCKQVDTSRSIAHFHILDTHEIENIIPTSIFAAASEDGLLEISQEVIDLRLRLEKLLNEGALFIDMKMGLCSRSVDLNSDPEYKVFWNRVLNLAQLPESYCSNVGVKNCSSSEYCQAILLKPFPETTLTKLQTFLLKISSNRIGMILSKNISPALQSILDVILSMNASLGKIVT